MKLPAVAKYRRALPSVAIGLVLIGVGLGYSVAQATAPLPPPLSLNAPQRQQGFADLVATVKAAVVNISTEQQVKRSPLANDEEFNKFLQQFFGPDAGRMFQQSERPQHALGSGFIVDPRGYIVTNNHVIDDASDIEATLSDGSVHRAWVVGRDTKTDLALLRISSPGDLPYVAFGDSSRVRVGDWVVAVGNPYGLGGSVSAGIISGEKRNINAGPYDSFLQVDAPINPGNSGGPLFDQTGHVIGIDTAIYTPSGGSVGIGFAIPSSVASRVVSQLRQHGRVERGWLGVEMQALTPALARATGLPNANGVLVDMVTRNSPAARAGIEQGDVIERFNQRPVGSLREFALAVADQPAGEAAQIAVWRNGHTRQLNVVIGSERQEQIATAASNNTGGLGLELGPLSDSERMAADVEGGAMVEDVLPGSRAEESGMQAGDIILRVGPKPVHTPQDVSADIRTAKHEHKPAVSFLIDRNGVTQYVALPLANGVG